MTSNRLKTTVITGLLIATLVAPAAQATDTETENDGWQFHLAPLYLWGSDLNGDMVVRGRNAPVNVAFSDVFDKLELAVTLHFEAWKGKWGLRTDFSYLDISAEREPILPIEPARVDVKNMVVMASAGYKFDDEAFVYFGVRYFRIDPKISLPLDITLGEKQNWVDPIIGFGWHPKLSKRWTFASSFDLGGFGVASNLTWSGVAAFDWQVARHVALFFGYRALNYDYVDEEAQFAYKVLQQGPVGALRFNW